MLSTVWPSYYTTFPEAALLAAAFILTIDSGDGNGMNVLNNLPIDEPIYRYMKLNHFEEALRSRELVLVNPTLWDDPYELIPDNIWLEDGRGNIKARIQSCLRCCFCMCWSHRGQSDTLLQAYSRVKKNGDSRNEYRELEGVHIRTTPRKLMAVFEAATSNHPNLECFIGPVGYGKPEAIKAYVASLLQRDREILRSPEGIVRVCFSNEKHSRMKAKFASYVFRTKVPTKTLCPSLSIQTSSSNLSHLTHVCGHKSEMNMRRPLARRATRARFGIQDSTIAQCG